MISVKTPTNSGVSESSSTCLRWIAEAGSDHVVEGAENSRTYSKKDIVEICADIADISNEYLRAIVNINMLQLTYYYRKYTGSHGYVMAGGYV